LARPEFAEDIHPELDAATLQDIRIGSWLTSRRMSANALNTESVNMTAAANAFESILRRKPEARDECG
jgi:hypothetical protein